MYAALVVSAYVAAAAHLHESVDVAPWMRAGLALVLAFVLVRGPRNDRLLVAFLSWFGTFGLVVIAGQLWQRFVPDGTGNFIYIDAVTFTVSVASELLLALAGVTLYAARRG